MHQAPLMFRVAEPPKIVDLTQEFQAPTQTIGALDNDASSARRKYIVKLRTST